MLAARPAPLWPGSFIREPWQEPCSRLHRAQTPHRHGSLQASGAGRTSALEQAVKDNVTSALGSLLEDTGGAAALLQDRCYIGVSGLTSAGLACRCPAGSAPGLPRRRRRARAGVLPAARVHLGSLPAAAEHLQCLWWRARAPAWRRALALRCCKVWSKDSLVPHSRCYPCSCWNCQRQRRNETRRLPGFWQSTGAPGGWTAQTRWRPSPLQLSS